MKSIYLVKWELTAIVSLYKDFMDAWSGDEIATVNDKIVFEMKGLVNSTNNDNKFKNTV